MEGNVCARAQKGERKFEPLNLESCILLRAKKVSELFGFCFIPVDFFFILGLS